MGANPKIRRRVFGAFCLAAALILLLLGNTKPRPDQPHWVFLTYWGACFLFAGLAMITAIRDAGALRREVREQQRQLLENTLQNIESEKRQREKTGRAPGRSADLRD